MYASNQFIQDFDPEIYDMLQKETARQETHLELIASENYVSKRVMAMQGSVLTNKYAEGYPGKRYYGGCQFVDIAETLAIERVKKLFNARFANVQAHSGSQANAAAYMSLMNPGDTLLGMKLSDGGHLTHGAQVNFSGKFYRAILYGVNPETGLIDYDQVEQLAKEHKPKVIMAGFSAYSRIGDWKRFREIADSIHAFLMVDMAHVAGMIAAGLYPNPVEHAHIVTSTTHKTLRGPRSGLILCNDEEIAKKINSAVFPGLQGGPLMHIIAAKAVAFQEALQPEFKTYQMQILKNAKVMAQTMMDRGFNLVSGGTDSHLFLVNLINKNITGKEAENALGLANITVNKNTVPNEPRSPFITSGLRIGTPACTTRGFKEKEFIEIANWISDILENIHDEKIIQDVKNKVLKLTKRFPVYA